MSSSARKVWEEKTMTFYQISESNGEKVLWVRHEESSEPYRRGEKVHTKLHSENIRPVAGVKGEWIWDMDDLCNTRSVRYQPGAQAHSCPPTTPTYTPCLLVACTLYSMALETNPPRCRHGSRSVPLIRFCPASIAKVAKLVILFLATILLALLSNGDVWKVFFPSCYASEAA